MRHETPSDSDDSGLPSGDWGLGSGDSYHMSPEDFRRYGHEVVDWVADYLAGVGDRPVLGKAKRKCTVEDIAGAQRGLWKCRVDAETGRHIDALDLQAVDGRVREPTHAASKVDQARAGVDLPGGSLVALERRAVCRLRAAGARADRFIGRLLHF